VAPRYWKKKRKVVTREELVEGKKTEVHVERQPQ
jgi:hypothetical protein